MTNEQNTLIKLLFVIVPIDRAQTVFEIAARCGAVYKTATAARGTAPTQTLERLGIAGSDMVVAQIAASDGIVQKILSELRVSLKLGEKRGAGVAFSVPLSAAGGPDVLKMLAGRSENSKL
ncbi:MAG: hypothetical protein LBQ91_06955 [Oscillospiraceae bacterium]|jgi:hypothetical protein|nr:hypothetical protein [Oscillospiraceae bacterium]